MRFKPMVFIFQYIFLLKRNDFSWIIDSRFKIESNIGAQYFFKLINDILLSIN